LPVNEPEVDICSKIISVGTPSFVVTVPETCTLTLVFVDLGVGFVVGVRVGVGLLIVGLFDGEEPFQLRLTNNARNIIATNIPIKPIVLFFESD
jgi:hypothetical protein